MFIGNGVILFQLNKFGRRAVHCADVVFHHAGVGLTIQSIEGRSGFSCPVPVAFAEKLKKELSHLLGDEYDITLSGSSLVVSHMPSRLLSV